MTEHGSMTVKGESGKEYTFNVYSMDTTFKETGAVYIVSERTLKPEGGGSHDLIYIGETGDLSERFDDHHKAWCFNEHDADCISIHQVDDEDERCRIEQDLIDHHNPPCND